MRRTSTLRPSSSPVSPVRLFVLADCSNFYVACERAFDPTLEGRPVVVLSNNDGCVVARSEEVKRLGVTMAAPYFKVRDQLAAAGTEVFSSNYPLYANLSRRITTVLSTFTDEIERYSIDEAFLRARPRTQAEAEALGHAIRARVLQWTGIPMRVGLGPTKTLAKVASERAKALRDAGQPPVLCLWNEAHRNQALRGLPVREVWGVGPRWAKRLAARGVFSAADFAALPDVWIKHEMSIVALRTAYELRGISCLPLDLVPGVRKTLVRSRSFGRPVTAHAELQHALATHTARAGEKLRGEGLVAGGIEAYVTTKRFGRGPHRTLSATALLTPRTLDTRRLLQTVRGLLRRMYVPAAPDGTPFRWKKAGVTLFDLVREVPTQTHLFDAGPTPEHRALLDAVDAANQRWGRRTVVWGSQGTPRKHTPTETGHAWSMRQAYRSARYTTDWDDLLRVFAR
ncbi:MAG: Y-family DNA polymerase [Bacteroidota bacterium]